MKKWNVPLWLQLAGLASLCVALSACSESEASVACDAKHCIVAIGPNHQSQTPCAVQADPLGNLVCAHVGYPVSTHRCQ